MIGAFQQPQVVLADMSQLKTLPDRELSAGLAEVIKYALLGDLEFLTWLEQHMEALVARDPELLAEAVYRSCAHKARIVANDEKEQGERALLNLGHTFGHAIESYLGYGVWLHGEAVATGMVMAADLSKRMGWISDEDLQRTKNIIQRANLPIVCPHIPLDEFLAYMSHDKKVLNGQLRLVLLRELGKAIITKEFDVESMQQAILANQQQVSGKVMMAVRKSRQNIQAYIWWIGGLSCLVLALIFWAMTDRDEVVEVHPSEESTTQVQIQPEKVAVMTQLGALTREVRPLDLTSRVVTVGQHESEFRGTKFIQAQQKKWTIELFRAAEEDVIKGFVQQSPDRKNWIYFRLSGQNQIEQYVLSYGLFDSQAAAQEKLESLNLNLPGSIQPQAKAIADYVPYVNDLGAEEVKSASLYAIQLKPAPLPKETELSFNRATSLPRSPQSNSAGNATTVTTITRRDQNGNVVDVQRSQGSAISPRISSNQEE